MPRRQDIHSVLVIGSGPITIGQAAEFDYSGTQAIKALRREGLRIILVNSNPATIMTDPELADATYIEPLTPEILERIIAAERPDAILPTVGGQTGLNLAIALAERGVLDRYGVALLGASVEAITLAEDRLRFKETMEQAGLAVSQGGLAHSLAEARVIAERIGFPLLVRASFTLGGAGGGIARGPEEFAAVVEHGLRESPVHQVLVEQSVLGWKEFELEVMTDRAGNFVVICGIENLDPMGVHTGDSITVAPCQTLTDKEYQRLRDMARRVMAAIGVQTGGSNVQFAIHPQTGETLVIEMNPRVSRSSALASKATGFAIAKIAALVAIGYTLDELPNDITGRTVAAYEPSLDYVVVKAPRWGFEKFSGADPALGPQMKSIGEVMAIGRTFSEALGKAIRSLENGRDGLGRPQGTAAALGLQPGPERLFAAYAALLDGLAPDDLAAATGYDPWFCHALAATAARERTLAGQALATVTDAALLAAKRDGFADAQLARLLGASEDEVRARRHAAGIRPTYARVDTCAAEFQAATPYLYSTYETGPEQLDEGPGAGSQWSVVSGQWPVASGQEPGAGGHASSSLPPDEDQPRLPLPEGEGRGEGTPVFPLPLGEGQGEGIPPHRATPASPLPPPRSGGQGGHAGPPLPPLGTRNSELGTQHSALSTPHSALAAHLDDAPVTDRPSVIVLGSGPNRIGQGVEFDYCCCHAVQAMQRLGYEAIMINCNPETVSTDYDTSDRLYFEPLTTEDVLEIVARERPAGVLIQFGGQTPLKLAKALHAAGVPIWGTSAEAIDLAEDRRRFGALLAELEIPQPEGGFATGLAEARLIAERIGYPLLVRPSYVLGGRAMAIVYDEGQLEGFVAEATAAAEGHPLLLDRYLEDSYELDVDALGDGEQVVIGGIMEHIEEAGVHSGDSACCLPPYKITAYHLDIIRDYTRRIGLALGVRGLLNVQYAIKDDIVYVIEANPRASRTVPFVSKATGVPLARLAAWIAAGRGLAELGFVDEPAVHGFFVKEAVFPFRKLPGADAVLGPEMRSTGEVMGHAASFGHAFAKSQLGAGEGLPAAGAALLSVNDYDKTNALKIARDLHRLGFALLATEGTAAVIARAGLPVRTVKKVSQGSPHVADLIKKGEVALVINTPLGRIAHADGASIRQAALRHRVPLLTTLSAAAAAMGAIQGLRDRPLSVRSLQEHYAATNPQLATAAWWSPPTQE